VRSNAVVTRCLIAAAAIASIGVSAAPAGARDAYKGRLDIRHTDDMSHGKSSTRYTLRESKDKRYTVRPALPPNFPSGSKVVVRGTKRGSVIRGAVRPQPGVRAATAGVIGEYKTAVLLFNFADDRTEPWTSTFVRDRFFGTGSSIDTFFKEQSWNQVDLTGEVYGWYELNANGAGCDVDAWAAEADSKATTAGVPLGSFHSIVYVFPDQYDCNWAGLAELPGNQAWLNGDISVRVASHELGHNMGVHHAAALSCSSGGTAVALSSSCSMSEYGDPFSTMGNATRRMAGWHLQQLGYLAASNVQTVSTSGTYTVRTSLNQSADPVLLKIARTPATSPAEYYYVDLRAAGGVFDNFGITDPAVKGVTIRVGNSTNVRNQSKLIDTTPDSYSNSSTDFIDASLQPNRTFTDGTVSITATSVSAGTATVEVAWNGTPPDTQAPSAPAITDATHYGSYVDLSWSAATDNVGVSGYRIKRNGQTIASLGSSAGTYRDHTYGTYTYCVEAFDAAANSKSSGCVAPSRYTPPQPPPTGDGGDNTGGGSVTPPPADVTPPAVKVLSPGKNASLRKKATIRANATDNAGVQIIEFWVDNVRLATRRGGNLSLTWKLKRVRPGKHKVMVLARDAAGNTAKRTVTVRVRR
jgi:hypothetical protein